MGDVTSILDAIDRGEARSEDLLPMGRAQRKRYHSAFWHRQEKRAALERSGRMKSSM